MEIAVVALLLLAVILMSGAKKKKNKDRVKIIATVTPDRSKDGLAYLVGDLEEVMTLPMLQRHPDAIGKVRELQEHYSQQLGAS